MDKRISDIEDTIKEIDILVKKNINLKIPGTKHLGNVEQYKNTKSENRNRGRRTPA